MRCVSLVFGEGAGIGVREPFLSYSKEQGSYCDEPKLVFVGL